MLEILPARKGFVVYDTEEQESVMRFDSYRAAVDLVVELIAAESRERLQGWISPTAHG
jgi:hypothetical protein